MQFISSDEINLTFGASAVRVGRRLELTGSWPGQRLARLSLTHLSLHNLESQGSAQLRPRRGEPEEIVQWSYLYFWAETYEENIYR